MLPNQVWSVHPVDNNQIIDTRLWWRKVWSYWRHSVSGQTRWMGPVLVSVPCELENYVYSVAVGWSNLQMLIISCWLMVLFSSTLPFLNFFPCWISPFLLEEWWSPNCKVGSFISPGSSTSFCLIEFDTLLYTKKCVHNENCYVF